MRRRDWFIVLAFLTILGVLAVLVRPAHGDDFLAHVAALEKQNAAPVKKADPFAGQNAVKGQPCGCPYCTCNSDSNCGSPLCPKLNSDPQGEGAHRYSWAPLLGNPDLTYLWDGNLCLGRYCYSQKAYFRRSEDGYEADPSHPPLAVPSRVEEPPGRAIPATTFRQPTYFQPAPAFGGGCST